MQVLNEITMNNKENINHQAYIDVLSAKYPQSINEYYIECYNFWRQVAGNKHFDSHYELIDYFEEF